MLHKTLHSSFLLFVGRKNLANLRNAEKERRQQIENSAKQLRQSEITIESYKRKSEASKARIKVLEHELNIMKGNIAVLNEKRSHDDRLIEMLTVSRRHSWTHLPFLKSNAWKIRRID